MVWIAPADGSELVALTGEAKPLSGTNSLVADLAATLKKPVRFVPREVGENPAADTAFALIEGLNPGDEVFLVSDEHGVVPSNDHGGPVGDQFAKVIFFQHGGRFCRVRRVLRLGLAAPGIPGKKSEGIRSNGQRGLHHHRVSAGCGKMTAKITQNTHSFLGIIAYSTGKSKFSLPPGSADVL